MQPKKKVKKGPLLLKAVKKRPGQKSDPESSASNFTKNDLFGIKDCLGISDKELAQILLIEPEVLTEPDFKNIPISRIADLQKVVSRAVEIFTLKGMSEWFHQPHPELEDQSPLEVLRAPEGDQKILQLLAAIEWGVPV
jgi:hypothetical protein